MANYNKPSIIDEINSFGACDIALFTTFNFDFHFFDRSIFLPMLSNNKTKTCVFIDSNEFQASIKKKREGKYGGNNYFIQPFLMNKAFHPKIILLIAKNKAKLIVTSANLTDSSHYRNNEIFKSYSYDDNHTEYLTIFRQAFDFFRKISSRVENTYVKDLIQCILDEYVFLLKSSHIMFPTLLHSFSENLLSQISKNIPDEIKLIRVAVPFYDQELAALYRFKTIFKKAKIQLFLQNSHSTFPKSKYSPDLIDDLKIFNAINNNEHEQKEFYHGKIFDFVSDANEYYVFGSPNFSVSALLKSFLSEGNIECCVLDKGNKGCLDSFFECFKLEKVGIDKLITMPETDIKIEHSSIVIFIEGIIQNDKVRIQIKSDSIKPQTIRINANKIDDFDLVEQDNHRYLITFKNILNDNIFDLEIEDFYSKAIIKCFVSNIDYLNSYISSSSKNPFKNIKTDEDIENLNNIWFLKKFEDMIENINLGIIQERNSNYIGPKDAKDDSQQVETNEDDDEEDEEFNSDLFESPDFIIHIDDNNVYKDVVRILNYKTKKVSLLFDGHIKKKKKPKIYSPDPEKTKNRKQPCFMDAVLRRFANFADSKNTKFDKLDFSTWFGLYELFSETFIQDLYLFKTHSTNISKMTEIKMDFFINRIFPLLNSDNFQKKEFEYLKKEIALLCLEINSFAIGNMHTFKKELINLDLRLDNELISDIENKMKDVGAILEISNFDQKTTDFKELILNSPTDVELKEAIKNYFDFEESNINITNVNDEKIFILMNNSLLKSNFNVRLNLTNNLRDKISKYVERYFNIGETEIIKYHISIENYTETIENVSFLWDSKNCKEYECLIIYRNKAIPQIKEIHKFED